MNKYIVYTNQSVQVLEENSDVIKNTLFNTVFENKYQKVYVQKSLTKNITELKRKDSVLLCLRPSIYSSLKVNVTIRKKSIEVKLCQ